MLWFMSSCLSALRMLRLAEIYNDRTDRRLDRPQDDDFERLKRSILETPENGLVFIDARGLQYLGYSFSKHTIRKALLSQVGENAFGRRRFALVSALDETFLDGLNDALAQRKLLMYVIEDPDVFGRSGILIGAPHEALRETFNALLGRSPTTTGDLARMLDTTPQNAKNRLDRLEEFGLVVRKKVVSETGGHEWLNYIA